jgi:hypothetical protein
MSCFDNTVASYAVLLTILSFFGVMTAISVEYFEYSQYFCNFLYGVVITLYVVENWTLLADLQQKSGHSCQYSDNGHIAIITELTSTNHELARHNTRLKDTIAKLNEHILTLEETQSRNITNWKNQWDKCLDLHVHTHHDLASSTSISPVNFFNVAPLKVPVITAM